ncbi:ATP-binding cassette sub-family B member 7, mitochondrial isoform X1 [Cimex lectularius]|uniref:Iron-sulfur clusters transporter ABCB7, mitochondrial n=2 Tax=Cimex lectularius TaxID=79782 RepID=A0A8I6S2C2_CIMLE|nr:ATP-binding cassette sub-family B member 7, mitochondrial isoform X1 [Cimex lectularius]
MATSFLINGFIFNKNIPNLLKQKGKLLCATSSGPRPAGGFYTYRNYTALKNSYVVHPSKTVLFDFHDDKNGDRCVVTRAYKTKGTKDVSIPPAQKKRDCFHPGTSSLARETISLGETKTVTNKEMINLMLSYIWPKNEPKVKATVALSLGLLIGSKLLNVATPFFFKYIVDDLNNYTNLLKMGTAPEVIATSAATLVIGYGIARAGAAGFGELRNAVFARVAQNSIRNVARNVFAHLHQQDLSFHLSRRTGALSKAIDRGSRGINFALSAMVFNVVPTLFELILVSTILAYKCGLPLGFISLGCVGLYGIFTLSITKWRTRFRVQMNEAENEAGNKAVDSLINFETVKYFNNEDHEVRRYDNALARYQAASLKTTTSLALLNFGQNAIFSGALALAMYLVAEGVLQGTLTVGDMVMVNGLLFQLSIPLNFLGSVYREVRQALIDMQTLFSLMKREPEIKNSPTALPLAITTENSTITFENVSFQYVKGKQIFEDLSFTIPAGMKIAIVGGSGTGKSTITRLLYRFFDPTSGNIYIAGKNIQDLDLDHLRRSIAIVPQDSVLFHDTILYNLRYGNLDRSEEEAIEASKMANLHNSVMAWPQQYNTPVGERGLKLSGGEKQRVAIARAILKGSPILIFDEATSSLDSITEHNILDALDIATEGRTSICIAHRLSTIMDADEILVLDKGGLAERGTHESLLSNSDSLYSKMWEMQHDKIKQAKGFEAKEAQAT